MFVFLISLVLVHYLKIDSWTLVTRQTTVWTSVTPYLVNIITEDFFLLSASHSWFSEKITYRPSGTNPCFLCVSGWMSLKKSESSNLPFWCINCSIRSSSSSSSWNPCLLQMCGWITPVLEFDSVHHCKWFYDYKCIRNCGGVVGAVASHQECASLHGFSPSSHAN